MSDEVELYRHYDYKDRLLYIGISKDSEKRARQHRENSEWFVYQDRMTVEVLPNKRAALDAEKEAIQREAPPYNKNAPACKDYEYWYNKTPSVMARRLLEAEQARHMHYELLRRKKDKDNTELEYWIRYIEDDFDTRREPFITGKTTMNGEFRANVKAAIVSSLGGTDYEEDSDTFILNERVMILKLQDPIY